MTMDLKPKYDELVFSDIHRFGEFLRDHPELKVRVRRVSGARKEVAAYHPVRGDVASLWAYSV
jgi:hypothetical protein